MTTIHRLSTSAAAAAMLALSALAGAPGALAGDAMMESKTAAQHAQLAADSADLEMVRAHLHHAVNCLVGPDGDGFDSTQANPCQDQGSGAIPDAGDAAIKQKLEAALAVAMDGLATDDLAQAQMAAIKTGEMLNQGM